MDRGGGGKGGEIFVDKVNNIPPKRRSVSGPPLSASVELKEIPILPTTTVPPIPIKAILHDDPKKRKASKASQTKEALAKPVTLFAHLSQFSKESERNAPVTIHPSIVKFSLRSADYENLGGSKRCQEMLNSIKDVWLYLLIAWFLDNIILGYQRLSNES